MSISLSLWTCTNCRCNYFEEPERCPLCGCRQFLDPDEIVSHREDEDPEEVA